MESIKGNLFLKNGTIKKNITLTISDGAVRLEEEFKIFKRSGYKLDRPIKDCPLVINFKNGMRFEAVLPDLVKNKVFSQIEGNRSIVYLLENNIKLFLISIILTILLLIFGVKYGIPYSSGLLANMVSKSILIKTDILILDTFDGDFLKPSELSEEKKSELRSYIQRLDKTEMNIKFRKSKSVGPNAFALAGNTIIFTDELVNLLIKPEYIYSIYLHEKGHLEKRHVAKNLISVMSLNALSVLLIGDLSGLGETLGNISYSLIALSYSRDLEREADMYAVKRMKELGISANCLKESLLIIADNHTKSEKSASVEVLSTHPSLSARLDVIKKYSLGCGECILQDHK